MTRYVGLYSGVHVDIPYLHYQDSLITETLVSVITKAVITLDDGRQQLVAIKAGKAKKKLVLEPHDIVKELRLLSSLSHPAVRLHISPPMAYLACLHTGMDTDHQCLGPRLRCITVITAVLDALHALYACRPSLYSYLFSKTKSRRDA
jgi:hypothetical protein